MDSLNDVFDDEVEEMEDDLVEVIEDDIEELIEEELGNDEEMLEDDVYLLMRDVLDQNVEEQHLPSEKKFDVLEGEKRDAIYRLKDDASIRVFDDDTSEYEYISGEVFNERLMDEYGMDSIVYTNGEADFSNFTKTIHKSDIQDLIDDEVDKEFIGHGFLERSADSVERYGDDGTITEAHEIIAKELDCDIEDVKNYLKENRLVVHEEGRDGFEVVPFDIHNTFDHTGSIGIKKDMNAFCESIVDVCENDSFTLVKDDESIKEVEGLEEAIRYAKDRNKRTKSELY